VLEAFSLDCVADGEGEGKKGLLGLSSFLFGGGRLPKSENGLEIEGGRSWKVFFRQNTMLANLPKMVS
jgi:hypothetical protein